MSLWMILIVSATVRVASAEDLSRLGAATPGRTVQEMIGDPGTLEPATARALEALPEDWAASLNRLALNPPSGVVIADSPGRGVSMVYRGDAAGTSFQKFYDLFLSRLTHQQLADVAAAALTSPGTSWSRAQTESIGVPAAMAALAMAVAQNNGSLGTTISVLRPENGTGFLLDLSGEAWKIGNDASPYGTVRLETSYRTAGGATYLIRSSAVDLVRPDTEGRNTGPQGNLSLGVDAKPASHLALGVQMGLDGIQPQAGPTDPLIRGGSVSVNARTHRNQNLDLMASASVDKSGTCISSTVTTGITLAHQWQAIAQFSMNSDSAKSQPNLSGQLSFEYTPGSATGPQLIRQLQRVESEIRDRVAQIRRLEATLQVPGEDSADDARHQTEIRLGSQRAELSRLVVRHSELAGRRGVQPNLESTILEEARRQASAPFYGALVSPR